ncbi:uncharacterized protein TNCV_1499461 [Trichonephila clavipes]|nr:uncharacterized protein TNCV_1499461 [Trichonephila clavipes]
MYLIVQVVRQDAVIQIPEMGQHFQVDCKKSQLFKNLTLVRYLDDDEASVSLGQVTKLAPPQKDRYSRNRYPGRWFFRLSRSLMYLLARLYLGVVRRFEWSTVRQITSGSLPSSGMLAIVNSRWDRLATPLAWAKKARGDMLLQTISDSCSCQPDRLVCGRGEVPPHDCTSHVLLESMVFQERMLFSEPTEARLEEILQIGKEYSAQVMNMTNQNSIRWQTMYHYVKSGFPQH